MFMYQNFVVVSVFYLVYWAASIIFECVKASGMKLDGSEILATTRFVVRSKPAATTDMMDFFETSVRKKRSEIGDSIRTSISVCLINYTAVFFLLIIIYLFSFINYVCRNSREREEC